MSDVQTETPRGQGGRRESPRSPHEVDIVSVLPLSQNHRIQRDIAITVIAVIAVIFALQAFPISPSLTLLGLLSILLIAFFSYQRFQDHKAFRFLLLEAAYIDPLTHIKNHMGIERALEQEASRLKRHQAPFSILMIDIDDFSSINEVYGYKTGDQVLIHLASLIGKSVRITDSVGRFSGETFVVILSNTGLTHSTLVAERIRKTILNKPLEVDSEQIAASVSIGVAEHNADFDNTDKLINHATDATRHAKERGKNQVACWPVK